MPNVNYAFDELMNPVLQALKFLGGSGTNQEIDDKVVEIANIPSDQLDIILTSPEIDKLRQLGDRAFLYVVTHCGHTRRNLHMIQNLICVLTPEMLFRQVQYLVTESDWDSRGEGFILEAIA